MRLYPLQLLPENININFIKLKKINYIISLLIITISILWSGIYGFNFGIDFIGGITMDIRSEKTMDLAKMRQCLNQMNIGEVILQSFGSENDISIRIGAEKNTDFSKTVESIKKTLESNFDENFEYRKVDFVGPQIGYELIMAGAQSIILAFLAIMVYIWFRFEWQFGVGVIISLIHDAVACLGFMSLTGLDFNLSTVAAILTVIGYSVNDSVVIYDRIRENFFKYRKKTTSEIINLSINQTLSRTTLTVLTTLIANISLIMFGGEAIRSFSLLVFFGILIGTYSSIFVSAPVLTIFNFKKFGNN